MKINEVLKNLEINTNIYKTDSHITMNDGTKTLQPIRGTLEVL